MLSRFFLLSHLTLYLKIKSFFQRVFKGNNQVDDPFRAITPTTSNFSFKLLPTVVQGHEHSRAKFAIFLINRLNIFFFDVVLSEGKKRQFMHSGEVHLKETSFWLTCELLAVDIKSLKCFLYVIFHFISYKKIIRTNFIQLCTIQMLYAVFAIVPVYKFSVKFKQDWKLELLRWEYLFKVDNLVKLMSC